MLTTLYIITASAWIGYFFEAAVLGNYLNDHKALSCKAIDFFVYWFVGIHPYEWTVIKLRWKVRTEITEQIDFTEQILLTGGFATKEKYGTVIIELEQTNRVSYQ